jgi:catechol 2,3-dioxygenase-like lactoylglutathione lyase family enzyme
MAIVRDAIPTHTTLECLDIGESLRFYREVLGLSTAQHIDKAGLFCSTNYHITAIIQLPKISPQPLWNYHTRPVPREALTDIHDRVVAAVATYGIREVAAVTNEGRWGIDTLGFNLCDRDGNWWRIEENDGPFGACELPAEPSSSIVPAGPISYVTLEVADIDSSAAFYRDALGLEIVEKAGALHCAPPEGVKFVAVPAGAALLPQPVLNHHGLTLPPNASADVENIRALLVQNTERFGLHKILPVTRQHGSYSFYFQDRDTNWWEIETLEGGLDPWQRASLPDGDARLLDKKRGRSSLQTPFTALHHTG